MKGGASSRRARWRKWAWRLLICLALGAATTVGVAWGFAAFASDAMRHGRFDVVRAPGEGDGWRLAVRGRAFGRESVTNFAPGSWSGQFEEFPVLQIEPWWARSDHFRLHQSLPISAQLNAFGWPRLAMWHVFEVDPLAKSQTPGGIPLQGGLSAITDPRALPCRVLASGFLTNAGIYSLCWFVALYGIRDAIERNMMSRGRCPKCAYDLRHDFFAGCPECGWNRASGAVASQSSLASVAGAESGAAQ